MAEDWRQETIAVGDYEVPVHIGDMPHAKVMRNLELFADKVLPHLPRRASIAAQPASA